MSDMQGVYIRGTRSKDAGHKPHDAGNETWDSTMYTAKLGLKRGKNSMDVLVMSDDITSIECPPDIMLPRNATQQQKQGAMNEIREKRREAMQKIGELTSTLTVHYPFVPSYVSVISGESNKKRGYYISAWVPTGDGLLDDPIKLVSLEGMNGITEALNSLAIELEGKVAKRGTTRKESRNIHRERRDCEV